MGELMRIDVWTGEACNLSICPPGLFLFGETLGWKSIHMSLDDDNLYQCDAYCVSSGRYFWGGAESSGERSSLIVQPLTAHLVTSPTGPQQSDTE
jgi:hypothetical protein